MTKVSPLHKAAPAGLRESWKRTARGQLLRARAELGLSQLALSFRLGVARSTVERWEAGVLKVPGWALVALGEMLAAAQCDERRSA